MHFANEIVNSSNIHVACTFKHIYTNMYLPLGGRHWPLILPLGSNPILILGNRTCERMIYNTWKHSTRKMELIHSDVCRSMSVESIGQLNRLVGASTSNFVTFIDDYSRCCAVYFTKQKSEVFEKFKEFEAITTNTNCCGTVRLRTDNGGEYLTKEFMDYFKSMNGQYLTHQNRMELLRE